MKRKGQGLSINMLVIIALAIFVIFLVLGFLTGGWKYFAGMFGSATKGAGGYEVAKIKCDNWCLTYQQAGCPAGYLKTRLTAEHSFATDTNEDGEFNDCYSCAGDADCAGEHISRVIGTNLDSACGCGGEEGNRVKGDVCTENAQCLGALICNASNKCGPA